MLNKLYKEIESITQSIHKLKDYLDICIASNNNSKILTLKQVCIRLGISRSTLIRNCQTGGKYPPPLPDMVNGKTVWSMDDILNYELKY